jgi:uncharacterized protein
MMKVAAWFLDNTECQPALIAFNSLLVRVISFLCTAHKAGKMDVNLILLIIVIGLIAGVVSGMVGIGGGLIIIPALVFILKFDQGIAQGTSLAMMLPPIGIFAAINYAKAGMVNWKVALILAAAFIIGGWVGSKVAVSLPELTMKKVFAALMIVVAVKMLIGK